MPIATTSSIWRSTGGDTTRTATSGTMSMHAPFYIANVAATGNLVSSSLSNASTLILPAGAVVTSITITNPATAVANSASEVDFGYTPLINPGPGQNTTLGTNVPSALLSGANVTVRTSYGVGSTPTGASLGNVLSTTSNLSVLTFAANAAAASGSMNGVVQYFVVAPEGELV